ncbi:MAG: hypothetical protein WC510_04275 [Candidatus Omnitrophota bacterium]
MGEITNPTGKSYRCTIFKIVVFDRSQCLGSGFIRIHDFEARSTRAFDTVLENIDYKIVHTIFRYEILFEAGY